MVSISSKTLNENETARRVGVVVQPSDGRAGYVPDSFYGQPSSPVPSSPVPRAPCPVPVPVREPCRHMRATLPSGKTARRT